MKNTVAGVICEYNPFHRGHRRQFELIREQLPGARIVCLMSGPFTQRGDAAVFSPADRARAALQSGADLVLELPCLFSVREADGFALGGVSILDRLGFVDFLSFGCEDNPAPLQAAAELLEEPSEAFRSEMKKQLDAGLSPAAAQGKALETALGAEGVFDRPNNILAIAYLRAIRKLGSRLQPLPVRREGDYHAAGLTEGVYPSAEAVRAALAAGQTRAADEACGYPLCGLTRFRPDALDPLLIWKLRTSSAEALSRLPGCTEGLENRLKECAACSLTRAELLEKMKTRRYSLTRLNRLLTHALLDISGEMTQKHPLPEYVRILGLRYGAEEMTREIRNSKIPVIAKAADGDPENELFALDARAWELWALGAGLPAGLMYTAGVVTAPPQR